MGITDVAWRDAATDAGWTPEPPSEYCPRCASSVGPFEADADGCPACRSRRLAWQRAVRLGPYEGVLREAILAAKYTAWRKVGQELGRDLGLAVRESLRASGVDPTSVLICPVATSTRRRLGRGVDHTAVLAREVARACDGSLIRGLRRKHRPPQTGRSVSARQKNVAGSFHARPGPCRAAAGRPVVLVDDVRTSGATLTAAARALRAGIGAATGEKPGAFWAAVAAVTAARTGA